MDSGYYAAMTGLLARTQALDTAAGNLANAQTPGYRAEREYFRSAVLGSNALDSQLGRTLNNFGLLGGDRLNLAQGALQQTGNPLDLAIEGQGFFAVRTSAGVRYTRDGGFHRSQQGMLVTGSNEPVLSSSGQPVPVPPGEVSVGADGVLSVAGGAVGTVGVFVFPASVQISAEGGNRYAAPEGVAGALSKVAAIHQGAIESSNQDAIQGTLDLIDDAAPGGDDAACADRLSYRFQQVCHRRSTPGLGDTGRFRGRKKEGEMIRALYTAASGMSAQQMNLDTIANNLANSSTTGFRQLRLQFQDMIYQNLVTPGRPRASRRWARGCRSAWVRGPQPPRRS